MKLKNMLFLSLFLLSTLGSMAGSVHGVGTYLAKESDGEKFPPKLLDGTRIDLENGPFTLPANQPYHIYQGWFQVGWNDLSSDGKVYFKALTMTLTINDEPIKLHTWKRHFKEINLGGTQYFDVMIKIFYVEFPEDYFSTGAYNFELKATNIPTIDVTINFTD